MRSVAYDFGYGLGLIGLSTGAWYTHGWGAINPSTNMAIPDRSEMDLWIQYRPTEGPLKGFRVKTQYANIWQQGNVSAIPSRNFVSSLTIPCCSARRCPQCNRMPGGSRLISPRGLAGNGQ